MISNQNLQVIMAATANAFYVSQGHAYHTEIVDGGTKNKIYSFLTAAALTPWIFSPLAQIWPTMHLGLYQFIFTAFSSVVYYIASIAHQNQIYINQGEEDKIQKLPFNCHNNQYLMDAALFLSQGMNKFMLPFYVVTLVSCIFLGAPMYGYISLAMFAINLLNQHGYFPEFLKKPYLYLNVLVVSSYLFGVLSWFNIALFSAGVGYALFDYIRCHLQHADSPTPQFPMNNPQKKLTVIAIAGSDLNASKRLDDRINQHRLYKSACATHAAQIRFGLPYEPMIKLYCRILEKNFNDVAQYLKREMFHETLASDVHVTFNHFYESHQLVEQILSSAPSVDYNDYFSLFEQVDFTSPALRNNIANEMSLHDKYQMYDATTRCAELNLPLNTAPIDVQIAFLKREMTYFVDRLNNPSYKDLTAEQVAVMHRYARLLLPKIADLSSEKRNDILLYLAICTGSHCNRIYLETLSSLAEELGCLTNDHAHTLRERAMLAAQASREIAFRTYYYQAIAIIKKKHPTIFGTLFDDVNDYHTYEIFVRMFGANFYLRNPTLTLRYRTTEDIYRGITVHKSLTNLGFRDEKLLFSQIYNADYLVDQVITPGTKLHPIFIAWCEERFPSCYQNVLYDEDYLINKGAKIKALAELMLLDLDILELNEPYPEHTMSPVDLATLRLPMVVREEVISYFKARSNPQDSSKFILLMAVKRHGVSAIWDIIKDQLARRFFAEFDMVYTSMDSEVFHTVLETAKQVDLGRLPDFDLWDSEVYLLERREFNERRNRLVANSIFQASESRVPYGLLDANQLASARV
ncbi:MAG: hypothetical protein NTU48_10020 [Legionellales bacterium]|nr:hypothetical protein [Legionellales bacterium]